MNRDPLRRGVPVLAALAAGLALLAFPGAAAAERPTDGEALATVTVYANGVDFLPRVATAGASLTVAGNGIELSRSFAAGEPLTIGMFDAEGQLLADGTYSWELELLPDGEAARALRQAAERNGGEAPNAWRPLTGSFTIRDGLMADPGQLEPATAPARALGGEVPTHLGGAPAETAIVDDSDAAVGRRRGVERRARAAAAKATPPALDRPATERSDATALALGGTLEERPAPAAEAPARPQPTPNDGADGRGRSRESR